MYKIAHESKVPLYKQVKKLLQEQFIETAKKGDRLPTEFELIRKLHLNRKAIRRALEDLQSEGLILRRQRKGSFFTGKFNKTLKIAFYNEKLSFEPLFAIYNETHPDITLEKINLEVTESYSRQITNMIMKNEVDIVIMTASLFKNFDVKKCFLPLNDYARDKKASTYEIIWDAFKRQRSYYAVPFAFTPVVMAYRKSLFDAAGLRYPDIKWTWDDFKKMAEKLTVIPDEIDKEKQYGFLFQSHINRWPIFIYQNGGSFCDRKGNIDLSKIECKEAISFLYDLLHKCKVSPFVNHKPNQLPFLRAKVAMTMAGYIEFDVLRKMAPFQWDIAPLPGRKNRSTFAISYGAGVAKNSRNLLQAFDFLNLCQSERVQKYFADSHLLLPVNKKQAEQIQCNNPENFNIFKDIIPDLTHLDYPGRHMEDICSDEMNMLWNGLQTYEQTWKMIKKHQVLLNLEKGV